MKDYYKILGVKEDASPEEIRDHYVELAKRYHPDVKKSAKESGKMKEINEAYGVLKDGATRMDYDLQRSLRKAYLKRRGKKRERPRLMRRAAFLISILFLFSVSVLSGFLLWKRSDLLTSPSSVTHPAIHSIQARETEPEVRTKEGMPLAVSPVRREPSRNIEVNSTRTRANAEQARPSEKPAEKIEQSLPPVVQTRSTSVIASDPAPAPFVSKPESPIFLKQEPTVSLSPEPPATSKPEQTVSSKPEQPISTKPEQTINPKPEQTISTKPEQIISQKPEPAIRMVTSPKPPLLVEDEVRQFLAHYMDRYVRKDIKGFLSLFSPKAIQNGKDGLDKIEGIYLRFFDQSERLIYRLEDIKIVIDGAGAEITGYYQVTQRLKNQKKEKLWKGNLCCVLAKEEGVLKIRSLDYQHQKD